MTHLRPGDDVFGWCSGALAEYASGSEDHFLPKLTSVTYEEADHVIDYTREDFTTSREHYDVILDNA